MPHHLSTNTLKVIVIIIIIPSLATIHQFAKIYTAKILAIVKVINYSKGWEIFLMGTSLSFMEKLLVDFCNM
jgi:hypothetical protein